MSDNKSYVPREWNDDDRYNDYISYLYEDTLQYVPVYKLLKEMYDEEKAKLYQYDLDEEYLYKYGELLYDEVYTNGYYEELYYEMYSETGDVSDTEDIDLQDEGQHLQPVDIKTVSDDVGDYEDKEVYKSKFIYM